MKKMLLFAIPIGNVANSSQKGLLGHKLKLKD